MMPGRDHSSVTPSVSARVAPSASAASRSAVGAASSISRDRETIVGRIMIASTTPALSMPSPNGNPENSGRKPRWPMSHGSIVTRSHGARLNTPHMP